MNEMLAFLRLARYRESRIETKKAQGGLPRSVWETYSAFANTRGGVILLGVTKGEDGRLYSLPTETAQLKRTCMQCLQDKSTVSVNLLKEEDFQILSMDGKEILAIFVPRADRRQKPVYLGENPMTGTYRRDESGNYRCQTEVVRRMLAERTEQSADASPLLEFSVEALDDTAIAEYRARFFRLHADARETPEFLNEIGAAKRGTDGFLHPTRAGLLFFGKGEKIASAFPRIELFFQGHGKIIASRGTQTWNLFRFYGAVLGEIRTVYRNREIADCVLEVLCNALVNADYDTGGVSVSLFDEGAEIVNVGTFRISPERAADGISDPRNRGIATLFSSIGIGKGIGGGLARVFCDWGKHDRKYPAVEERFSPPSVAITLWNIPNDGILCPFGGAVFDRAIIEYLTRVPSATAAALSACFHLSREETEAILHDAERRGLVSRYGADWFKN